jgi:hypothetical protein
MSYLQCSVAEVSISDLPIMLKSAYPASSRELTPVPRAVPPRGGMKA